MALTLPALNAILSTAVLAFASAAPLGLPTSPILVPGAFVFPAAVATIPSGDIQAAFIDAKVQAEDQVRLLQDQARAAADQARLAADQTRFLAEQTKEQPQLKSTATSEVSGAFVVPAGVATISSGDIQAAFIDAKVQAEDRFRVIQDQARAAADQARLIADQTRFFAEQAKEQPQLKVKGKNEISGPFVLPATIATISPGDIQAAFIDAKVQAEDRIRLIEDQSRAAADEARLIADQTRLLAEQSKEQARLEIEKSNEKVNVINEHPNEKALEAFSFLEEQKRQVVEAWKAVEAEVNEAIAKDTSILAKQTGSGTVLSPKITVDTVLSPFPGLAYTYSTPGIVAPVVKSTTDTETSSVETEINKVVAPDSSEKAEVTLKTASVTDESKAQETIGGNAESLTECNQLKSALSEETSEPQQIVTGSTTDT